MKNQKISIPVAIVIAGIVIAGAIIITGTNATNVTNVNTVDTNPKPTKSVSISEEEHILGSPDALIKIIEFSDLECPYCKRFHLTMQQIMNEYGKSNQVAWVYKHFPLDQLHSKARKEAEATECADELGGNQKFWEYTDRLFEITPSNNGLDLAVLPEIAEYVGLDKKKFNECLESGRYVESVEEDVQAGISAGARGTPFSLIIAPDGSETKINGAETYDMVKNKIENILKAL